MLEKKSAEKGYPNQGWARNARIAKRVSKSRKAGKKGIRIAMIRVQAVYVEWVGNFRQHVSLILTTNQRHKTSELKPLIRVKPHKKKN